MVKNDFEKQMTDRSMHPAIRRAFGPDIPMIADIIRKSYLDVANRFGLTRDNCPKHPSNCRRRWVEVAMQKGVQYFILELRGRPCGCVALEQASSEACYLERLAVLPDHRGRGHGRALVEFAVQQARQLGVQRIDIGIISRQTELKAWYRHLGFKEIREATFGHLPFDVMFMSIKI